jgi:hypothetical protein
LLTSTLSFWRVKRWERSIIASTPTETPPDDGPSRAHHPLFALARFGFPGVMWRSLRGNPTIPEGVPYDEELMLESNGEQAQMLPRFDDPESIDLAGQFAYARATETRLQNDLRAAGLL